MNKIKKPSIWMNMSEVFRAMYDFKKSAEFVKSYRATAIGDGHPVVVIPGFLGSKLNTYRLRKFITKLGYKVYDWGQGRNYGNLEDVFLLGKTITKLHLKHQQKVTLIGWSLGGIYVRELAKIQPKDIRQVITLGSPFSDIDAPNHAAWLFEWLQGDVRNSDRYKELFDNLHHPAPVPTTAVFSKEDGVVPWQACCELMEDGLHQNVEVKGSHLGFPVNAAVWFLISDRLRYTADNWKLFEPSGVLPDSVVFPAYN